MTLTDQQADLRNLARTWVDREVVPHDAEWDRAELMDRGIVGKLGEVGFLGTSPWCSPAPAGPKPP